MIVDTSALIAVLIGEPERDALVSRMARAAKVTISAATYLEAGIVVDTRGDAVLSRRFDTLLQRLRVEIVPVGAEQARMARAAYRDFGRGSGHPARLNYGDCFAYALAQDRGEELLFVGNDFGHTDVRQA